MLVFGFNCRAHFLLPELWNKGRYSKAIWWGLEGSNHIRPPLWFLTTLKIDIRRNHPLGVWLHIVKLDWETQRPNFPRREMDFQSRPWLMQPVTKVWGPPYPLWAIERLLGLLPEKWSKRDRRVAASSPALPGEAEERSLMPFSLKKKKKKKG